MKNLLQSIKNTISYINHNNDNSIHIGYGIDNNYARQVHPYPLFVLIILQKALYSI